MKKRIIIGIVGLPIRNTSGHFKFLLTQRYAPHNPTWHLKWQLAGGALDFGETPEQCLIREFEEELSVKPTILFPYPIVKTSTWKPDITFPNHSVHIVLPCYLITINNQTITITDPDKETNDAQWFEYEQIQTLECLPNTVEYVQDAINLVKTNNLVIINEV